MKSTLQLFLERFENCYGAIAVNTGDDTEYISLKRIREVLASIEERLQKLEENEETKRR